MLVVGPNNKPRFLDRFLGWRKGLVHQVNLARMNDLFSCKTKEVPLIRFQFQSFHIPEINANHINRIHPKCFG
ncbi:hypothetical protein PSACC_01452 [Paramicrosporidium saccamoebae]|uniref:Uncharacterized protein n=1 Tax=Paramicrosporidium saccamoebae TaxID=1246581 RepID=A0A2H9TLT5_9FUNG|nr:hypothetical protein PSACC_01452 [Paramicrosporidium saccamoebae]